MSKSFFVSLVATCAFATERFVSPTLRTHADLDVTKRPVIGVLTEPLRGDLVGLSDDEASQMTYIPKTHVQFLE